MRVTVTRTTRPMHTRRHPLAALPAADLFPLWAAQRRRARVRPLSEASVATYAPIWALWCEHLRQQRTPWPAATPETLAAFARSRPARSGRHPAASPVTRSRYWRVIQDVYRTLPAICLARGWEPWLPPLAQAAPPLDANSEDAEPTFVPAATLGLLVSALDAPLPDPRVDDVRQPWAHVRNRALLAAQLDAAATVRELARLTVHDVLPASARGPAALRIAGGPPHALRTLPLSPGGASWLTSWLALRATLPCPDATLFVSAKGFKGLTPVTLWRCLAGAVQQTLAQAGEPLPYHFGPNMLRNSVLLAWLESRRLAPDTVAAMAGLKAPRSLARLVAQASEPVRAAYAAIASGSA